jgi:hypothetical protein
LLTRIGGRITGAGPIAVDAVREGLDIPPVVSHALDEICRAAEAQGSRLWMDAEQQVLQAGIDTWTINLMRKYNNDGKILVYNTIQAYLKGAKANLDRHVALAAKEGWGLGVKLVRGAYIEHEMRSLIHNTKEQTDKSYDLCADTLISQRLPEGCDSFPQSSLFLASHNAASVTKAFATHRERCSAGLPAAILECGQIAGMADELSCNLIQGYEECINDSSYTKVVPPKVYKYLAWGTVAECMGYLHRRAIENRGAVERTKHMAEALGRELRRRMLG